MEELQKTDPEAALERLEELERVRIEERMSLRHKTSKWAQLQGLRATRDKNVSVCLCMGVWVCVCVPCPGYPV